MDFHSFGKMSIMNEILIVFCCLAVSSMSAQTDYPFPWNPDADLDGWVSTSDLLSLLTVFDSEFNPTAWETDSLNAAVVLDGAHSYFACQNHCHQIEGHWKMADLDAFGRHYGLVEGTPNFFWVNSNKMLEQTTNPSWGGWGYQLYGGTGQLSEIDENDFAVGRKCLCYIQSSPFVPSQLTEDSNLALWSSLSDLQEQVDSLTAIVSSGDEGTNQEGSDLPIGTILAFASDSIPEGWMFCDGREIAINEFPLLFELIGTTYGAGDSAYWAQVDFPATTFNIPDFRGRTLVAPDEYNGMSAQVLTNQPNSLGGVGGEEVHQLSVEEMPNHNHAIEHGTILGGAGSGLAWGSGGSYYQWTNGESTTNVGGDEPHNNMQPYAVVNYILRVE